MNEWMDGVCAPFSQGTEQQQKQQQHSREVLLFPQSSPIASFHGTMDTIETSAFIIIIVVGCTVCRNVRPK